MNGDMAEPARPRHRYGYAEYLAYERDSELKHEFYDGEILAMAGGSRRHNALALRIGAALHAGIQEGYLPSNPTRRCGSLIPSLQEYVLVAQGEPRIERYRRLPGGTWEYSEVKAGSVRLSTGAVLDLDELYLGLPV
jgi:Uma2 family endonuclease